MKVSELQQLVGRGEYRVEPGAVAEAILRRLIAERRLVAGSGDPQAS